MVRLPPKEEKEVSNGEDSFGDEQIQLGPYRFFDRYFHEKDGKGFRKGQGQPWMISTIVKHVKFGSLMTC
ncbi:Phytosulfokines 5 [Hordeum vulgare]|nr:Phytosulfokines 5 [Hordeum vulgare]